VRCQGWFRRPTLTYIYFRLPTAIRNVDTNLDQLLTKMTSDSVLPVTIPHLLHRASESSDTINVVAHRVRRENWPARAGYREPVSATRADRHRNTESPEVTVCMGGC
jgi:hypothetical protein